MKKCAKCGTAKPLSDFYFIPTTGRHTSYCRDCYREYQRARLSVPDKRAKRNERAREYAKGRRPEINEHRKVLRALDGEYRDRENERDRARQSERWIRAHYGLTREQWQGILDSQGGGCAICGRRDAGGIGGSDGFHVDRDHRCCSGKKSCGKCIRGLLCNRCNPMLGYADDSADLLREAGAYLEKWQRVWSVDDKATTGAANRPSR